MATQNTERKLLSKIRGRGRGWAFSQRDFTRLASRGAIDVAFHRLLAGGTIRRVIRGIYESELQTTMSTINDDATACR